MRDRRLGYRIPLDVMVNVFVNDRPVRALVLDVSDTGVRLDVVHVRAPEAGTTVQLEITLPGVEEPVWASGTVRRRRGGHLADDVGIRFVAMAAADARALRDFCVGTRHRQLGNLLARIARPAPMAVAVR
jgi:c-di-GMP-binding flagellar brake protein YcgR